MWRYQVFARKLTWYFIGVYIINRGYYMATWRYKISLWVLKNISRVSTMNAWSIFSTREEKFLSPSGHVVFYVLFKHQWSTNPFHLSSFFAVKGTMYYVAIATVILTFYFHTWRYQDFAQKLTWYFIGVYIIDPLL